MLTKPLNYSVGKTAIAEVSETRFMHDDNYSHSSILI